MLLAALTRVLDDTLCAVDYGKTTTLVLLDYSTAFDTLDKDFLCAKLSYYGVNMKTVHLFASYLGQRLKHVRFEGKVSEVLELFKGVP